MESVSLKILFSQIHPEDVPRASTFVKSMFIVSFSCWDSTFILLRLYQNEQPVTRVRLCYNLCQISRQPITKIEGIEELWVSPKQHHFVILPAIFAALDVVHRCFRMLLSVAHVENVSITENLLPHLYITNKIYQLAIVYHRLFVGGPMLLSTLRLTINNLARANSGW